MSEMRQSFDNERRDFQHRLEESHSSVSEMERKLRAEAQEAAADYARKVRVCDDCLRRHKSRMGCN